MSGQGTRPKTTASGAAQRQTPRAGQLSSQDLTMMKSVVIVNDGVDESKIAVQWADKKKSYIRSGQKAAWYRWEKHHKDIAVFLKRNPNYIHPDTLSDKVDYARRFMVIYEAMNATEKKTPHHRVERRRSVPAFSDSAALPQSPLFLELFASRDGSKDKTRRDRPLPQFSPGMYRSKSLPALATSNNSGSDQPDQWMETNLQAANPGSLRAQERPLLNQRSLELNRGEDENREPVYIREIKDRLKSMDERQVKFERSILDEFGTLHNTLHRHETALRDIQAKT